MCVVLMVQAAMDKCYSCALLYSAIPDYKVVNFILHVRQYSGYKFTFRHYELSKENVEINFY